MKIKQKLKLHIIITALYIKRMLFIINGIFKAMIKYIWERKNWDKLQKPGRVRQLREKFHIQIHWLSYFPRALMEKQRQRIK